MTHPSHQTRFSDSSLYDEKCVHCGVTDHTGMDKLNEPCAKAPIAVEFDDLDEIPDVLAALGEVKVLDDGRVELTVTAFTIPTEAFHKSHLIEAIETNAFDYRCILCGATDGVNDRRLAVSCTHAELHPNKMSDEAFLRMLPTALKMDTASAARARLSVIADKVKAGEPLTTEPVPA